MKSINLLVLAVTAFLLVLGAINRAILITPIVVSFGVTRLSVPLGLMLLGLAGVLTAVFIVYLLKIQLSALAASRKHAGELRTQRELADAAEVSRYTELRRYLEQQFESLCGEQRTAVQRLREELTAMTNSLAACIGEIDERLDRQWPIPPNRQP
jgi:hypothetical protein